MRTIELDIKNKEYRGKCSEAIRKYYANFGTSESKTLGSYAREFGVFYSDIVDVMVELKVGMPEDRNGAQLFLKKLEKI